MRHLPAALLLSDVSVSMGLPIMHRLWIRYHRPEVRTRGVLMSEDPWCEKCKAFRTRLGCCRRRIG